MNMIKSVCFVKQISILQRAINNLAAWTISNGLTLNPSKCQAVLFSWTKKFHLQTPPLNILGNSIPWSDSAKYLGLIFDRKLIWRMHNKSAAQKMHLRISKLYPLFRCKTLPDKIKAHIYKQCIRTAGTYSCGTWATSIKTRANPFTKAENHFIRTAYKPERGIPFDLVKQMHRIHPISDHIHSLAKKQITDVFANSALKPLMEIYRKHLTASGVGCRQHFATDILCYPSPK